ncbi:MAG: ATP-binding protein [Alphaproteobacteria bacterium]
MLCNLNKKNKRPDKALQSKLIALMYFLGLLFASIIALIIAPQYFIYIFIMILLCVINLFVLGLKIVKASEKAISFGGFANAIIKNDAFVKRIESINGEVILENSTSEKLFGAKSILKFISKNHIDCQNEVKKLKKAFENLSNEEVEICLNVNELNEYYIIKISPIFLKKEDIFDKPFSLKKVYKESFILWSLENITSKKSLEKIFIQEQKLLLDFLDYLPVGIYTIDDTYNIEYANYALANILDTNKDALIGRNLKEFLSTSSLVPQSLNLWSGRIMLNIANSGLVEVSVFQNGWKTNDNKIKNHGVVITGLASEKEINSQLNFYRNMQTLLFDNSPIGMIFASDKGKIKNINPSALEFIGNNNINICSDLKIDLSLPQVNISTNDKNLSFYINKSFLDDEYILFVIDTSKQKSLELQFSQAQKMQALGQMATGISHDFNNLLTAMIGFCDLLIARHGVGDPSFADLIQIKQNATRAAGLVQQLLAFSRKQSLNAQIIDVVDGIGDVSHMLKRILGEKVKLDIFHDQNVGHIKVDPTQLSQVIINLAINAKDAMEGKGTLKINTYNYHLREPYIFGEDIISPKDFVCIEVSDSGCGIDPDNLSKIFDPFFSTKQNVVGSGTGLGLAMVYGIISQTGGFIKVKSIVGKGTTFYVYLPLQDKPSENSKNQNKTIVDGVPVMEIQQEIAAPINVSQKMILGLNVSTIDRQIQESSVKVNKARVLFVEDEHSVRTFGVRALTKKGFEVIQAANAEEALEILNTDKNFQILFSDVVMPGISGAELAKMVKGNIIKDIKVILTSGYTKDLLIDEGLDDFEFEFLAKPYSLGDLTKMVVSVL